MPRSKVEEAAETSAEAVEVETAKKMKPVKKSAKKSATVETEKPAEEKPVDEEKFNEETEQAELEDPEEIVEEVAEEVTGTEDAVDENATADPEDTEDLVEESTKAETEDIVDKNAVPDPENTEENVETVEDEAVNEEVSDETVKSTEEAPAKDEAPKKRGRKKKDPEKKFKASFDMSNISEEEVAYMSQKRRFYEADADTKKELYEEDDIVAIKGVNAKSLSDLKKEEHDLLLQATQSIPPLILDGEIVSVSKTDNDIVLAHVNVNGTENLYDVCIPASQLYFEANAYRRKYGADYQVRQVGRWKHAKIRFTISYVDEKEMFAYASRINAMQIDMRANYIKQQSNNYPKICIGKKVPANVVAVRKDSLVVEVGGVDVRMGREEISYLSIADVRSEFKVGDTFLVVVKSIEVRPAEKTFIDEKQYTTLDMVVSRAEAYGDPHDVYYKHFRPGMDTTGVITSEIMGGGVFVRLQNKMDALCSVSLENPTIGAECDVRIKSVEKKMDKKRNKMRWMIDGFITDVRN